MNCLGCCMNAYSFKHSMAGGCHTHFYRLHRHTTFATPQPQLENIANTKNKSNQQAKLDKKNCAKAFYLIFISPYGKRALCSKCRQTKTLECKAGETTSTIEQNSHKQAKLTRKKKAKPKAQRNYKKCFIFIWYTIGYNCRLVLIIILMCAEVVSWCAQPVVSAFGC